MITLVTNETAEMVIGGVSYGTFDIGKTDIPDMVIRNFQDTLLQIATWGRPSMNFLMGEGTNQKGLAIIGKNLYAIEKNEEGLKSSRLDYTALGLAQDATVEEAVLAVCSETIRRLKKEAARWVSQRIPDEGKKRQRNEYELALLHDIIELMNTYGNAKAKYKIPPEDRYIRELEQEIAMATSIIEKRSETVGVN